ncbi:MAG: hypothetical protein V4620_02645 [Bacteroidota bacterium]
MERKIFWLLNLAQYISLLLVDYIYMSYYKGLIRIIIHIIFSLTAYPILLAALINLLIALIPFNPKSYKVRWKESFVYTLFGILFFFLTGNLAYIVTH